MLEFIKYSRDKKMLEQHMRETDQFSRMNPNTAELINLVTDSKLKLTVKEGKVDMCLAIREMRDESMAAGKAAGRIEGKLEGKLEGKMEAYAELAAAGAIDVQFAAKKFNLTVEEFIQKTGITIPKN